jgi:hypothetical protein
MEGPHCPKCFASVHCRNALLRSKSIARPAAVTVAVHAAESSSRVGLTLSLHNPGECQYLTAGTRLHENRQQLEETGSG